ncbi:MAG: hypothetical protein KGK07_07200 [Chloroflexota bacterium]|nr:hypothetical protein [Chloroflexota bacterium]
MREETTTLWRAIGSISSTSALMIGSLIATWTVTLGLLAWVQFAAGLWSDRRISVLTLGIDLVIIMVATIQTRRSNDMARSLLRAHEQQAERDTAILAILQALADARREDGAAG